jgi:hypothetical protein
MGHDFAIRDAEGCRLWCSNVTSVPQARVVSPKFHYQRRWAGWRRHGGEPAPGGFRRVRESAAMPGLENEPCAALHA